MLDEPAATRDPNSGFLLIDRAIGRLAIAACRRDTIAVGMSKNGTAELRLDSTCDVTMARMVRSDVASRLGIVAAYIRMHPTTPLDLALLADRAGFSPYHFHRIFRVVMGEPLGAYVRRERLQRAAAELRSGCRAVTEIARETGYQTLSAFTRAFTDHFTVPPSEFRANDSMPIVPEHALPWFCNEPMAVDVVALPARRLLALRHVGSYRNAVGALARLHAYAAEDEAITRETEFLGLSYDDPATKGEEVLRFDACLPSKERRAPYPLRALQFAGGRYAVYRHVGPFTLIEHVVDRLFDAVAFSGAHKLRNAPCVEIYRTSIEDIQSESFITDVHIPIA